MHPDEGGGWILDMKEVGFLMRRLGSQRGGWVLDIKKAISEYFFVLQLQRISLHDMSSGQLKIKFFQVLEIICYTCFINGLRVPKVPQFSKL